MRHFIAMRYFFAALFLGWVQTTYATPAVLPESVRDALKRANIPLSSVGIVVQKADARKPFVAQNAKRPMNPASTMKLLTTFAALETLGPAYRWKTEAYLGGTLEDGVLQGDLVFKGYGDPKLNIEQFWLWVRELRQRGLREIRGDIVLDCSFFQDDTYDPAGFDNDPTRAYNVGPNALLLNFNALRVRVLPVAGQPSAVLEPDLSGYSIKNRIRASTNQPCRGGDNYSARLEERDIILEGTMPAGCGEAEEYFSLLPHGEYFFAVFSALWREMGGTLQGKMRSGNAPENQLPFSTRYSPPLSEVIRDINKFSNNIMARQVFLTLGTIPPEGAATSSPLIPASQNMSLAPRLEAPSPDMSNAAGQAADDADPEPVQADAGLPISRGAQPLRCDPSANIMRSTAAMRNWLSSKQLQFPELVLENGSGLSRAERISAQSLAALLQRATRSPFFAELAASMPILGMDGTMKRRFKDSEIAGYGRIKTGMLEGVKSVAGYVQAQSGDQWIVVFIINHPNARRGKAAQDALIEWVHERR